MIELAVDGGLSQTEIADRTGLPLGTVKSHARRGLKVLRDRLTARRPPPVLVNGAAPVRGERGGDAMNAPPPDADDARIDRALFGPTADAPAPPNETADEFARLAAALVEVPDDPDAPPPHLLAAVRADAGRHLAGTAEKEPAREPKEPAREPVADRWWHVGWFTKALLVVLVGCVGLSLILPATATGRRRTPFLELPPAQALAEIASDDDALRAPLSDPDTKADRGEALWSGTSQRGVLKLTGLEANDPTVSQYQLWIFDALRDERYPVDGGVFDVPADGPAVVPFTPRVKVSEPTLFAVTVEPPGGVVVSDRKRLPAIGEAGS